MRTIRALLTAGIALALISIFALPARAEGFDKLASGSVKLHGSVDLAGLFWARTATCTFENDFMRRQCEAIRGASARRVEGKTFILPEPGALVLGAFDEKTKSLEIRVEGCVACGKAIELGGQKKFLIGSGKPLISGESVRGEPAYITAKRFPDAAAANSWLAQVAPRLKTDLLVRIPKKLDKWSAGEASGLRVQIVGVRVHDPCDGAVVAAKPAASALSGDPSKCGEAVEPAKTAEPADVKPAVPAGPTVPARLSPSQINASLRPARRAGQDCFDTYGVEGTAKFRITIANNGKVLALEQLGDFAGTPTGDCIEKVVKATEFPKSKKKRTTITYPIMLR